MKKFKMSCLYRTNQVGFREFVLFTIYLIFICSMRRVDTNIINITSSQIVAKQRMLFTQIVKSIQKSKSL